MVFSLVTLHLAFIQDCDLARGTFVKLTDGESGSPV